MENGRERLYSVYHAPVTSDLDWGVVLCYPFAQEYIRCHKLYVNLANRIAAEGFHTLRFDYHGTGDSPGDFSAVSIEQCRRSIGLAIEEMKEAFGVTRIILAGVRLGATLSLLYSSDHEVDGLILWNPVYSGEKYLDKIEREYQTWLSGSFTNERSNAKGSVTSFGFTFSPDLVKEIKSIVVSESNFTTKLPTLVIDDFSLAVKGTPNIIFETTTCKEFWIKRDNEREKSIVPMQELNRIIDWLKQLSHAGRRF